MSTDTSTDTDDDELRFGGSKPTGVARCDALEGQSEPYLTHGVALGADEVTHGANGPKFWPSDELRRSAQSLVGVPLTKNHDDERVEAVVGEVIDAGFEPDVGIVFEAEIDDEELATKVARGRLEVSVHAIHRDGGRTSEGELIVEDVQFLDLSLVPRGGSPSNLVQAGESPSEVLASLSAGDVAEILDADTGSDTTHEPMTDDTDEPEDEELLEADESEPEDTEEAEVEADEADVDAETEEAEAEADESDEVDSEEAEVEADETGADSDLEETELREELNTLRSENQELRNELESVRLEYAEQLSTDSPFEAAELAEKFSFDELREKFDEAEASLVTDEDVSESEATPAPQTGDTESAELSTGTDSSDEEIAELESKIERYDEMGWDAAKVSAEERLDELRA